MDEVRVGTRPKANTQWVRDYYAALAQLSQAGGYVNFALSDDQSKVAANYARLQEVKRLRPGQPLPPEPEHPTLIVQA